MNIFSKKVPKWVTRVKDPSDKEILIQLSNYSSKKLSHPRSVEFVFRDVKDKNVAEDISQHLQDRQWQVVVGEDDKTKEFYWVEAVKENYVIEEETFIDDMYYFNRLATMYGVTFDGWEAEQV